MATPSPSLALYLVSRSQLAAEPIADMALPVSLQKEKKLHHNGSQAGMSLFTAIGIDAQNKSCFPFRTKLWQEITIQYFFFLSKPVSLGSVLPNSAIAG